MAIAEIRLKRAEQDIETLRSTQTALMDRIDSFAETLEETRDIARENRSRLDRIGARLDKVEARLDRLEELCLENRSRLDRLEELCLENRTILFAIADHLDLTYEKPPRDTQPD